MTRTGWLLLAFYVLIFLLGFPWEKHMTNDRVALDKDWRIFAEPYLEGFQLTISRGHYDEEVILSADEAKALRDWLCARYPVEPSPPQKVVVLLIADYGHEGQSVEGVYADRASAEAAKARCKWSPEEWMIENYEVRAENRT